MSQATKNRTNTKNKKNNKKKVSRGGNLFIIGLLCAAIGFGAGHLSHISKTGDIDTNNIDTEREADDEIAPVVEDNTTDGYVPEDYNYDEDTVTYSEPVVLPEDSYLYVNEEVYNDLVESRNNFERLFSNGTVSDQMRANGIEIGQEHFDYVDQAMPYEYELVRSYTTAYENGDYMTCYENGKKLSEDYVTHMSPQYVYNLLVTPKLDEDFRRDNNGVYDGNMYLDNGNIIHFVNDDDVLLRQENNIEDRFEYYSELPNIITDNYQVINNTAEEDSTVCNVLNVSHTDRLCREEINEIKNNASRVYGIEVQDIRITWDGEAERWMYANSNDEFIDFLDDETNARFNNYWKVVDSMSYQSADIPTLDNIVDNLDDNYEYVR